MIDGKMYWVKGWTKTTRSGEKWISLSFTLADEHNQVDPRTDEWS
jgi:hypothetical protein